MAAAMALFSMGAISIPTAAPAAAQSACVAGEAKVVNVDGPSPAGHDWQFTDFFPRSSTTVHGHDCLHFHFDTGSPDGFHTATMLRTSETPDEAWFTDYPTIVPDSDTGDAPGQLQFNPAVSNGTFPPAGSGGPGACGDVTTPCTFDNSADINSGAFSNAPGFEFYVELNLPDPETTQTLYFVCLIHPGMAGSVTQVGANTTTTSLSDNAASAAAQLATDTSELSAAETAANSSATTPNGDGTSTVTVKSGTSAAHGDVLEFLPGTPDVANNKWVSSVSVQAGDKVRYDNSTTPEIHTASFPAGPAGDATEPLVPKCENASGDTDADFSVSPPCGDPTLLELHVYPQPQGPTAIASTATVASSGIIDGNPDPLPAEYTFSFPNAGTFPYDCHIHAHMAGEIVATPTLPAAGSGPARENILPAGVPAGPGLLLALLTTALALAAAGGLYARRRA
jgi:plastocyanin